jgi:hypothetical protein
MFNGLILGKHRQPQRFANAMRKLRRSGIIGEFVSIFVNEKQVLFIFLIIITSWNVLASWL